MDDKKLKHFYGNCINNPFNDVEKLLNIINKAEEITTKEFVEKCSIDNKILKEIIYFPNDFSFWKS